MRFVGQNGEELRLDVVGYQYPEITDDAWDSEWLLVAGTAISSRGRWSFRDPCFDTVELRAFIPWLKDVKVGGEQRCYTFLEPNLSFEHIEEVNGDVLAVTFSLESAPPWVENRMDADSGFQMKFPFALNDFRAAAADLEDAAKLFPIRAAKRGAG